MSVSRLIFAIDQFPDFIDPPQTGCVDTRVPLTARLALDLSETELSRLSRWAHLTLAEHEEMLEEVEESWQSFKTIARHPFDLSRHHFGLWQSNLIYLRKFIRRVLDDMRPDAVLIPPSSDKALADATSDDERMKWVIQRVVAEETAGALCGSLGESERHTDEVPGINSQGWQGPLGLTRTLRDQARRSRLMGTFHAEGPLRQEPGDSAEVLVIAQQAKVAALRGSPFYRSRVSFLPYGELESLFPPDISTNGLGETCSTGGCEAQLWNWLYKRASYNQSNLKLTETVLSRRPAAILTDGEHDVRIRTLLLAAVQEGIPVATIPEGATGYVAEHERFGEALRFDSPGITQFVLNEAEASLFLQRGAIPNTVKIVGYLGDTFKPSLRRACKSALLERGARRMATRRRRGGVAVGVSLDLLWNLGPLTRPGGMPGMEGVATYILILRRLSQAGFTVLVSSRKPTVGRDFAQAHPLPNVSVFVHAPWQWVARHSDVMVSWQSSVAWESIALGVPVVMPRMGDVPGLSEVTLRGTPDGWATVAEGIDELVPTVMAVASRRSQGDFDGPSPFVQKPQVVLSWIRDAVTNRKRD